MRPLLYQIRQCRTFSSFWTSRRPSLLPARYTKCAQQRGVTHAYQNPGRGKNALPEKLVVYEAGVIRTTFVGVLKVTTVLLFIGNLCFVVPEFVKDPQQPPWVAPAVAACGYVPMFYVLWASKPFVVRGFIQLPTKVRRSPSALKQWTMPRDTEIEFVTLTWFGIPRSSARVTLGDLRPVKSRFGIQNVIRVPGSAPKFSYFGGRIKVKQPGSFFLGKDQKGYIGTISLQEELAKAQT